MKHKLLIFLFVLGMALESQAHPPEDMVLTYNLQSQVLSLQMRHVTSEPNEHYIRTLTIQVNDNPSQVIRFTHQQSPSKLDMQLPVIAKAGDTIHVKAFCIKGGSLDADLKVIEDDKSNNN